jgi:hypothetical protein
MQIRSLNLKILMFALSLKKVKILMAMERREEAVSDFASIGKTDSGYRRHAVGSSRGQPFWRDADTAQLKAWNHSWFYLC